MTTPAKPPQIAVGDRVEISRGSWSECRGTVTAIDRGDWPGAAPIWVWVKLTGVSSELRFPVGMIEHVKDGS